MRALALWAVLFAAYAATVGIDTIGTRHYGGDEPRQLLVAESIVSDGAVDGAALLAALPWLGPKYLAPAAPVAVALVRWTARRGRRTAALAAAEIMVASIVVYATLDDRLYGGLTPYAAMASGRSPTGADSVGGHLARAPRLAALWI